MLTQSASIQVWPLFTFLAGFYKPIGVNQPKYVTLLKFPCYSGQLLLFSKATNSDVGAHWFLGKKGKLNETTKVTRPGIMQISFMGAKYYRRAHIARKFLTTKPKRRNMSLRHTQTRRRTDSGQRKRKSHASSVEKLSCKSA